MMVVTQPLGNILERDLASGLKPCRFNPDGSQSGLESAPDFAAGWALERLYGKPPRLYPDGQRFS